MFKLIVPTLAIVGLAAACATTPSDKPKGAAKFAEDPRLGEKVDRICFNRTIDGFSHTDRDTIVVSTGPNKDYLLEVRGICTNLRHAQSIAIDSPLSCVTRLDAIFVSTSAFSLNDNLGGPQRCIINEIYAWDEDADKDEEKEDESDPEESAAP